MAAEWSSRLKGHKDLVQKLVQEVPKALGRRNLTIDQAARLHEVIGKGIRDFDEVLQIMDRTDVDQYDRHAADSLARTWHHLLDEAEDRVRSMSEPYQPAENVGEEQSTQLNDHDEKNEPIRKQ